MGHGSQIQYAYDSSIDFYEYDGVFKEIAPIFRSADYSIVNLEFTFAGRPYDGYPSFSSPDEHAYSCLKNGINVMLTANNHSLDKGKKGLLRTLRVLDFYGIKHTGTFRDSTDRVENNLLILKKNDLKVGIINYTYGSNHNINKLNHYLNIIDTTLIKKDIKEALNLKLDNLIVALHWGKEYKTQPDSSQIKLANFIFENGADIIIGSHPHVLQPFKYYSKTDSCKEKLIVYSLGNLVSNQRWAKSDGGALFEIDLEKKNGSTKITNTGYHLVWVQKTKKDFRILACSDFERKNFMGLDSTEKAQMKLFIKESRTLLKDTTQRIQEFKNVNSDPIPNKSMESPIDISKLLPDPPPPRLFK